MIHRLENAFGALRAGTKRLWGTLRPHPTDPDLMTELELHLELAEEELRRQGHSPEEAKRLARLQCGAPAQAIEEMRDQRGFPLLDAFWLDCKLGARKLHKSWALTVVGGLAMTIAIAIGTGVVGFFDMVLWGSLPFEDGDRIVLIQSLAPSDAVLAPRNRQALGPSSLHDFERWRDALGAVEEIGAFQWVEKSLVTGDTGEAYWVTIAEISATAFRLARVSPLLGRTLLEDDERPEASPAVVIGYDVWQGRFASDPEIVGKAVRLGDTAHTIVGVMPEDFGFPVNDSLWTPLRVAANDFAPGEGPRVTVFGRLERGASIDRANAELTAVGRLPETQVKGTQAPETRAPEARVVPYTHGFVANPDTAAMRWVVRIILLLVTLLLIPPCANVAILVYARTVLRQQEFAARYALGASRRRLVGQIFIEQLVLAAAAAAAALVIARLGLSWLERLIADSMSGQAYFWMRPQLTWRSILFATALAILAALIAGVVPALRATRSSLASGLRVLGSRPSMVLGGKWTALVVTQVALSLALLPTAAQFAWTQLEPAFLGPGFDADKFLTARLLVDGDSRGTQFAALMQQLEAEADVQSATYARAVPGAERITDIEVEGGALPNRLRSRPLVRFNDVDPAFFDTFDVQLFSGRLFDGSDLATSSNERSSPGTSVIVNRTFVDKILGEGNPLGRRIRYWVAPTRGSSTEPPTPQPWLEIVGVVDDLPAHSDQSTMYQPSAPDDLLEAALLLRLRSSEANTTQRLQEIVASLGPSVLLRDVKPLHAIYHQQQVSKNLFALALAVVTLSVLLLSAAGMYALMSFTVNQRQREIGIRAALGAQPHRLLSGIFRRAIGQLVVGAAGGLLLAFLFERFVPIEEVGGAKLPGVLPAAALVMIAVGLLATVGPARRGLELDPNEALREG